MNNSRFLRFLVLIFVYLSIPSIIKKCKEPISKIPVCGENLASTLDNSDLTIMIIIIVSVLL